MRFDEFATLLHGPDMLRIIRGKEEVYTGYFGTLQYAADGGKDIGDEEVIGFRAVPEIRHKKWRERGLDAPLMPEQMPQYSFSDLMMTLYYTIYLKEGNEMGKYPWSGKRTFEHCGLITRYQDLLGKPRQQDGKCDGYQKSGGNDEPCETCKECRLNTFYEE